MQASGTYSCLRLALMFLKTIFCFTSTPKVFKNLKYTLNRVAYKYCIM